MDFIKIVKNVFSFGGEYRLEKAKKEHEALLVEYKEYCNKVEKLNIECQTFRDNVFQYVNKIRNIFSEFKLDESLSEKDKIKFAKDPEKFLVDENIGKLSSNEQIAVVGTSVVTPIVAGSLVSLLGSASTGTAISSLHGAAWLGSLVSWFGGGPVAIGGFGIALGSIVLPGLALLPFSYCAIKTHQSAQKIEKICTQLKNELSKKFSDTEIAQAIKIIKEKQEHLDQERKIFENGLATICEAFTKKILIEMKEINLGEKCLSLTNGKTTPLLLSKEN